MPLIFRTLIYRLIFAQICMLAGVVCAAQSQTPTEIVKNGTESVLSVLNTPGLNKSQRTSALKIEIQRVVSERFDFETMSKSVLSKNWRKATGYERDRFVDYFTQVLVHTYSGAIESYTGEEINYVGEKIRADRATVDTVILAKNGNIPVTYKMRLNDNDWHVYDVVIESASLVSNYRNLYNAIIKTDGIGGLLDQLEGRLKKTRK